MEVKRISKLLTNPGEAERIEQEIATRGAAYIPGHGIITQQDFDKARQARQEAPPQTPDIATRSPSSHCDISDNGQMKKKAEIVQFPIWPESFRGVPNAVLRSALFGVVRRGRRSSLERQYIATVGGLNIYYTGPRLDQNDLDIWEHCLHLAKERGIVMQERGVIRIEFAIHSFLRALGKSTGKSDHEWLKRGFSRLSATDLEVEKGDKAWGGSLVVRHARDKKTGVYVVELELCIAKLYDIDSWTGIDWEQRKALKGRPLAQWLHGFYSTHSRPYLYKVETVRALSGSEAALREFRRKLKRAAEAVADVTGWSIHINERDCVVVQKDRAGTG